MYYAAQVKHLSKPQMVNIVKNFSQVHDISQNNVIIGDFNFADVDMDKGKGMSVRDTMMHLVWEGFLSETAMVDPFRVHSPKRRIYSFVSNAGKSRGDRVYVNEENVPHVSHHKYSMTPFNNAHKILSFTVQDQQERGRSYWKLNSSVLNDNAYVAMVRQTIVNVDKLNIVDKQRWWDIFLTCLRSKTVDYTKRKYFIENSTRDRIKRDLLALEAVSADRLTSSQAGHYNFLKGKLRILDEKLIDGYRQRTRGLPKYEQREPDIAFYAKLEKRSAQRTVIGELRDKNGEVHSDNQNLMHVVTDFYTDLYTPSPVDESVQEKLLGNVDRTLTARQQAMLDAPLSAKELQQAVYDLNENKSPGLDGFTAEFYKKFWSLIKDRYTDFINCADQTSFSAFKNTSVTALLYKEKGDTDDLKNYRPISLINVDLKILTKTLTNRLKTVLPSIIHFTQTAVDGRRIDNTVHMLRDFVQLANTENLESAFIFLDQEKAFDRVNHAFLYKTMRAFGIGPVFIHWIRLIYSNATTRVKVNGFLSKNIPLRRGVRQGCPLSPLLYVLIIEILALQFRKNPDIVGFTVGGEKIVSMHYADDAIITILQNKCFKEVIKDLTAFEQASGAKVNYGKTKGLWAGAWKNRTDTPLDITWTNENVETLGVYFGNANPAGESFAKLLPKVVRSMNYWKQFRLCKLAKARVIEIFHASKVWYAARFYPIPPPVTKALQKAFFDYVNYPHTNVTVKQEEMHKLRKHGGTKLINIQAKAEASKIKWLIDLCVDPNLTVHLALMDRLLGEQKGKCHGKDLFFTTKHYARKVLKIASPFYTEAIKAMTTLDLRKQVLDPRDEQLFYNPIFQGGNGQTLRITKPCETAGVFTYGQLLDEVALRNNGRPHCRHIANLFDRISLRDLDDRQFYLLNTVDGTFKFQKVTQKMLYEQLLKLHYRDHHSSAKWVAKLQTPIVWDKVWKAVHNPLSTEETASFVWEQVHLNMYTTHSYNKWHKSNLCCPLCTQPIRDEFHIIFDCPVVVSLWKEIEPMLLRIYPAPVTEQEKIFGILGDSPAATLRNWLTYVLRFCIHQQESLAYHNKKGLLNETDIKLVYNTQVHREAVQRLLYYKHIGRLDLFHKFYTINEIFVTKSLMVVQVFLV